MGYLSQERGVVAWLGVSAFLHIVFEGWLVLRHGSVYADDSAMSLFWRQWCKVDWRFCSGNSHVLTLLTVAALVTGPLCVLLILAINKNHSARYPLQIVVGVLQAAGSVLSVVSLLFGDMQFVATDAFSFYVIVLGGYALWVVVPLAFAAKAFAVCSAGAVVGAKKVDAAAEGDDAEDEDDNDEDDFVDDMNMAVYNRDALRRRIASPTKITKPSVLQRPSPRKSDLFTRPNTTTPVRRARKKIITLGPSPDEVKRNLAAEDALVDSSSDEGSSDEE